MRTIRRQQPASTCNSREIEWIHILPLISDIYRRLQCGEAARQQRIDERCMRDGLGVCSPVQFWLVMFISTEKCFGGRVTTTATPSPSPSTPIPTPTPRRFPRSLPERGNPQFNSRFLDFDNPAVCAAHEIKRLPRSKDPSGTSTADWTGRVRSPQPRPAPEPDNASTPSVPLCFYALSPRYQTEPGRGSLFVARCRIVSRGSVCLNT